MAAFFVFIRDNARWLAGGMLLTFFSSFGQTFFISLSGNGIRSEFALSHGQFGSLYMIATCASAAVLPFVGRVVDHARVAVVAAGTIVMLAISTVIMATAHHWMLLVVALFMLRLFGQGMMVHNAMTAMGRWYAAQRGRAVSVTGLGLQAGEAALPLVFVTMAVLVGWRSTWFAAGALLVVVGLPLITLLMRVERSPRSAAAADLGLVARDWTRREALRDPVFWASLAGILAPGFIGTTIFFHPEYLVELRGWSMQLFATSYIAMSATTVVFALITGALVDRFSAIHMLPYFLAPLAAACFVLGLMEHWSAMYIFMSLLGVSYGVSSTMFGAVWPEIYGVRHLGAIRSVVAAMVVLSTALGPGITGTLIDQGVSYLSQIVAMGCYCIVASFIMLAVSRRVAARQLAVSP